MLNIQNLSGHFEGKEIIRDVSLEIPTSQIHVIMGPNGAGKSSLAKIIAGHPSYEARRGTISFCGTDLLGSPPDVRAKLGLFLSFQNPMEIPGVNAEEFLRKAFEKLCPTRSFDEAFESAKKAVYLKEELFSRGLYEGFSGGEKKRFELLEMVLFGPKLAILDEIDSGLDPDALKMVGKLFSSYFCGGRSALIITHNPKLLQYITPHAIHIMIEGQIVASGGAELASKLEQSGFATFMRGKQ